MWLKRVKATATGLVRSRLVSMRRHATSFKGRGVHHLGAARSWLNVSMAQQMKLEIILVDKRSLPTWTEPRKSSQMRYAEFVQLLWYLCEMRSFDFPSLVTGK
jgi:hypothetical protein